jgi:hypothetical protein
VKLELLLQVLGLKVLVCLLDCVLQVERLLVEHIVQLVEALPFHALFLLNVGEENLPAVLITSHLLQELRAVHLDDDPGIRPADHSGAVWAIEEYVVVTKDLPLAEQRQLEYLYVPLEPAQYDFALFLLPVDLPLPHHFYGAFEPAVVLVLRALLLSEHLAACFGYLVGIVRVVIEWEVFLLHLELPLPDDVDLIGDVPLLIHYLILDEGLGLQDEVDDFEQLRFRPHAEEWQVLQDVHLLQLRLAHLVLKDVLKVLFGHDCKVDSLGALNGCSSKHWLIVFEKSLFTEGLTASETHGLKIHFLLFWPHLLKNCKLFLEVAHFLLLFLMVVLDLHP